MYSVKGRESRMVALWKSELVVLEGVLGLCTYS